MSRTRYVYKNVRSVPPAVKLAVFEDAVRREMTMGDIIGLRLGEHFDRKYLPSGEKSIGVDLEGDQFRFQIPEAIARAVWHESRQTGETESSVVLRIVAEGYGLEHVPVKRGRKRTAAA
jgi:hypothetical protein